MVSVFKMMIFDYGNMYRVERNGACDHAQHAQIQMIPRMRKVSSGPFIKFFVVHS